MKGLNVGDAIRIDWIDSMGNTGWRDIPTQIDMRCVSVGFFVHQAKDRVVIAKNYAHDQDPKRVSWGDFMTIPKVAIQKILVLQKNSAKGTK